MIIDRMKSVQDIMSLGYDIELSSHVYEGLYGFIDVFCGVAGRQLYSYTCFTHSNHRVTECHYVYTTIYK